MARVPEEEIERLKSQISLERLAQAAGVKLKRHGSDLLGLCPFHDDHEPSLVISPEKNLWHCLGACQTGGSVIDWVMRAEGVSFRHAVELLREGVPSLAANSDDSSESREKKRVKHTTVVKLDAGIERTAADDVLMQRVVGYYQETLKQSPEALQYLASRGLSHPELLERFLLGYANRSLGYRLPQKTRQAGAELRGRLEHLGIFRESGHEHFNGSIVVPVFDEQGRVVEMYGRKITRGLRAGTPQHLYLPGPHQGVWNLEAFQTSKAIILCEALIDALTFWCAGYRNVTASYGIEGFTAAHRDALQRYGTERVYIAYDRDDAGERAAQKLTEELSDMGIEVYRVKFPRGMDANEYALKMGPAEQSLGLVIRQAEWVAGKHRVRAEVPEGNDEVDVGTTVDAMPNATLETKVDAPEPLDEAKAVEAEEELNSPGLVPIDEVDVIESVHEDGPVDITHSLVAENRSQPASKVPPATAAPGVTLERPNADEVVMRVGGRKWRIRGLKKNTSFEQLRVNVLVAGDGGGFHVDTIELYSSRQRGVFQKVASEELGVEERVIKRDLGELLLRLEALQEKEIREAMEPKAAEVKISDAEQAEAIGLLSDPNLLERILADFEKCGVVGERTNMLMGYLAATSRKLEEPLAVVIQSSSAAGKSSLMDAVLRFMPEEERVAYSAMTGQSLFYMGETDLQHKILAIAEEQGATNASYALKLLQSEGELTIASTGKDPATGRLVTQEYRVQGPVMIFLTTTAIEVDEELLNRCLVLTVDEGRAQTRAIHERQRRARSMGGVVERYERGRVMALHQNAQRMIRPLFVVNPYAERLRFPDHQTRTRRDHMKYLALIEAITLLHQYQRPIREMEHRGQKLKYVQVTLEDIELANQLCHEVLGRSLDELPPQTRRLLGQLDAMVTEASARQGIDRADFRFSRREVRDLLQWGNTQLKVHLGRLIELEYLLVHRGKQGQGYVYELAYAGQGRGGEPFLAGLIDVETLRAPVTDASTTGTSRGLETTSRGSAGDFAGAGRGAVGPKSVVGRSEEASPIVQENGSVRDRNRVNGKKARLGGERAESASYAQLVTLPVVDESRVAVAAEAS